MKWIGSRRFDLAFFFGGAGLSAIVGALLLWRPTLTIPIFFTWLLVLDGPHVMLTWTRTYLDANEWRERRSVMLTSFVFLLPGLVAWALSWGAGLNGAYDLFLASTAVWGLHHFARQNYGVLMIYERLSGASREASKLDGRFVYASQWMGFALFVCAYSGNRLAIGLPEVLDGPFKHAVDGLAVALGLLVVGYTLTLVMRGTRGEPVRPGLFALLGAAAPTLFAYFVIAPFEPLAPNPQTPEQLFLATQIVAAIPHGLQYVGIISVSNRRRFEAISDTRFVARIGRAPYLAWGLCIVASLGYILLNLLRGATSGEAIYTQASAAGQLFLAIYWGFFFHHYYLDQKIWRVSSDARVRHELGLGGAT